MAVIGKGQMVPNNARDLSNVKKDFYLIAERRCPSDCLFLFYRPPYFGFSAALIVMDVRDDVKISILGVIYF